MEINFKGYNLDYFKDKDLYTWEEVIERIEDMEADIYHLREVIDELEEEKTNEDFEYDAYRISEMEKEMELEM